MGFVCVFTLQCLLREKGRHRFFFILLVTIELNNKNVPFYFFFVIKISSTVLASILYNGCQFSQSSLSVNYSRPLGGTLTFLRPCLLQEPSKKIFKLNFPSFLFGHLLNCWYGREVSHVRVALLSPLVMLPSDLSQPFM